MPNDRQGQAMASDDRLSRVIAVINGKGGVGKTSISANLAGQLAASGFKVLAVDLDPSANLQLDLGYADDPRTDGGQSLVDAVWRGSDPNILSGIRDDLDVWAGGHEVNLLQAMTTMPQASDLPGGGVPTSFAAALATVAPDYDFIILDCSPGASVLQDMALAAARYLIVPITTDAGSWEGLRLIGPRVKAARTTSNPDIVYLGAVLFDHNKASTTVFGNTLTELESVTSVVPLFETTIRHSQAVAHHARSRGQLAHELAGDADAASKQRLAFLRQRKKDGTISIPPALPGTASSVAGDYYALAAEVLTRINNHETATDVRTVQLPSDETAVTR